MDCDGLPLKQALREYLSGLMPELRVELNSFEELNYDRIAMRQMLLQFSRANYLDGVNIPPSVPCTSVVGRGDHLLSAHTEEGRKQYEKRVLSLIPHAEVYDFDMDHYGRGPEHNQMIKCAGDSFKRYDTSPVPPHHIDQAPQYQGVLR